MALFAARYAHAFADVVATAHLDAAGVDGQLADFTAVWDENPNLREIFANPSVPAGEKIAVLDKINARLGMAAQVRNLIAVLIRNDRIVDMREVLDEYRVLIRERLGIRQAEIVTARALDSAEQSDLLAQVGKLVGAQVSATFSQDPALLAGAVVRIGSTVYDGSVRGRLDRLKEALRNG